MDTNIYEEWKDINGFSNYQISNQGRVRNKNTQLILKNRPTKAEYMQVNIKRDDDQKFINQYIHRLVALAFLELDQTRPEVNHKDKNKANNAVDNLEWVNHVENELHKHSIEKVKTSNRKIGMYDKEGNLIQTFNSIVEAFTSLGKPSRVNIDNVLQGKQKTAYGYVWQYLD